ncbi:hypothetical protein BDV28DRAFT_144612 [Aspergillus coremiiformis]|uniref:Uncharacterized protein n=1 Tax=Aspergillus coremiiformis TaxID=138285 RepID=A0A5N6ZH26_9EURO|nr:hypothetical protein BDV28DRAFT_144612 [Aspergillus coremiiformis]
MTHFHARSRKPLINRLIKHPKRKSVFLPDTPEDEHPHPRKTAKEVANTILHYLAQLGGAARAIPVHDCGYGRHHWGQTQDRYAHLLTGDDVEDTLCLVRSRPLR